MRMDRDRETENEARKLNAKSPVKDKGGREGSGSRSRDRADRADRAASPADHAKAAKAAKAKKGGAWLTAKTPKEEPPTPASSSAVTDTGAVVASAPVTKGETRWHNPIITN